MADFHLLRPWWLLALPLGLLILWRLAGAGGARGSWRAVVEPALQPYVLARPRATGERRWPLLAAAAAWLAAVLALSGPTWERVPVPAFRSDEALVVALDLSRSMDAADMEPSRLARARLKLLSLLDRRDSGQTGLVVFSAHAFTVTPLTTDTRTIASLVSALTTDIMPSQGSHPEAGLAKAGELLRQAGMTEGEILLISDATVSPQSIDVARELRDEGYRVSVLAVGTEEGAPIRDRDGGFLTDGRGDVVVPSVNPRELRRLASAGGGRFARLTPGDGDLDRLFPAPAVPGGVEAREGADEGNEQRADVWRDRGVWLMLLLVPLAALSFRRGWVCAWPLLLLAPGLPAHAFEWNDLWQRSDQRGREALRAEEPERAAELFEDREWRAAALYRSGDYARSAAALEGVDTAPAHYNRGNALARAGRLEPAVSAYERALELAPDHEDARYNRDLVRELLDEQNRNRQSRQDSGQEPSEGGEQQQDGEQQDGEQQDGESPRSAESSGEDSGSQNGERRPDSGGGAQQDGQRRADGESRPEPGGDEDRSGEPGAEQPDPRQAEAPAEETGEGEAGEDERQARGAPGPEDMERWASEQAADQWLRRIPQDPGGLLRRKFLYQYQRLGVDQDGNYVWPGDERQPW